MITLLNNLRIAFVSTYPPRECGIATFTEDIINAIEQKDAGVEISVLAVDNGKKCSYDGRVVFEISQTNKASYSKAAKFVNEMDFDLVIIEHEYGIFGGEAGEYILEFMRDVQVPIITTFHTILSSPSGSQRRVLKEIGARSESVITMAINTLSILKNIYDIPLYKMSVIPHGVPLMNCLPRNVLKANYGIKDRKVVSTFGLLSPGKGIEYGIAAISNAVLEIPDVLYMVLGQTHPVIKEQSGEDYRNNLISLTKVLNVEKNVIFVDKYFSKRELVDYLQMSDIYLTPYLGREQSCSGTLAYAVGYGKAMVSTPYTYAKEILADGRGILTDFSNSDMIATAIKKILQTPALKLDMESRAWNYGRKMSWSNVANLYIDLIKNSIEQKILAIG